MSLKHHVKAALDTLEALGFRLDHKDRELRGDRWIFTHANAPDQPLRLNVHMSEPACRHVIAAARVIAGLATSETARAASRDDRRVRANREAERRRREVAEAAALAKEAEAAARRQERALAARRSELDRYLRGKDTPDRATFEPDVLYTVAEIADRTGRSDRAVRLAIDTERLTGYVCHGGVVKVKGAEVAEWAR